MRDFHDLEEGDEVLVVATSKFNEDVTHRHHCTIVEVQDSPVDLLLEDHEGNQYDGYPGGPLRREVNEPYGKDLSVYALEEVPAVEVDEDDGDGED